MIASTVPSPEEFAAEYGACRARLRDVVADAGSEAATRRPIPACPEWDVLALCSHLTGIAVDLVAWNNPGPDVQEWVDRQIVERHHRSVTSVLDEWDAAGPAFEALIVKVPHAFAGLLLDAIAHEHDLRHALHRPGARDATGVRTCMYSAAQLLDRDLDRHGLGSVRLTDGVDTWVCGSADPDHPGLSLDLSGRADGTWTLVRLLGSRRSHGQLGAYPWVGDWEAFLPGLAHMPLPEVDLVE